MCLLWEMHSHAERWLVSKKAEDREPNLLALNGVHGGKFHLPDDGDWGCLHRLIVRDHLEGNRNFLVESKTPVFKLFLDIDFAHSHLGEAYILQQLLPAIAQGVSHAFLPQVVYQDIIVALSPPKPRKELTKTGVHLHWQQVAVRDSINGEQVVQPAVNVESAMGIREAVLRALAGLPDAGLNFKEVVDEAVLKKNGIRMLFSSKSSPCTDCLAAKRTAMKEHPCEAEPKAASFWRCSCAACQRARTHCKVTPPPKIAMHVHMHIRLKGGAHLSRTGPGPLWGVPDAAGP